MSIPKIVHRIWVEGSGLLPHEYAEAGEEWREMHPDWELMQWTVPPFPLQNQDAWDYAPPEDALRWRADVLRLELLLEYGGVYVDMDVIPLRPLDVLMDDSAWAGYSPDRWKGQQVVTNAIMAAEPGHRWIRRCVDRLPDSIHRYAGNFTAMVVGPHHV
ncbi:MAG: glycosyltransferase, partial [Egibacteraceae bacterium]